MNYLINRSFLQKELQIPSVLNAVKTRLRSLKEKTLIDNTIERLQHFQTIRLSQTELLIPYDFNEQFQIVCLYRAQEELSPKVSNTEYKKFDGNRGAVCEIPKNSFRHAIRIRKIGAWSYQTPWKSM